MAVNLSARLGHRGRLRSRGALARWLVIPVLLGSACGDQADGDSLADGGATASRASSSSGSTGSATGRGTTTQTGGGGGTGTSSGGGNDGNTGTGGGTGPKEDGGSSTTGVGTSGSDSAGTSGVTSTSGGATGAGTGGVDGDAGSGRDGGTTAGSTGTATGTGQRGSDGGVAVTDPGTDGDGEITVGPNYTTQPDLTDRGAKRGRAFDFTMNSTDSQFFKGDDPTLTANYRHPFTRHIRVYVPAAYVDGTEAPILVIQDGPGDANGGGLTNMMNLAERALDNLTIKTDPKLRVPPFVAISVQAGPADAQGSERGLEYDTMSDRYARFVVAEVLPAALQHAAAGFPHIAFTSDPEGHATAGCSSGAAAAMTMGWFRPDLFRRVITYSGTFVDQQNHAQTADFMKYPEGAWEYHSHMQLIANSDIKPLRIFTDHSQNDNGFDRPISSLHNWVYANVQTAAALKAKGYHYRHVYALGVGHCDGKVVAQTLADTLSWIWRGYPN